MCICALCGAMFLAVFNLAYGAERKEFIEKNDIPPRVQQFMKTHFGTTIAQAYHDDGKLKVETTTNQEVEFDKNGNWKEIENSRRQALPASDMILFLFRLDFHVPLQNSPVKKKTRFHIVAELYRNLLPI